MKHHYSKDIKVGDKVLVRGWVKLVRDLGGLKFFIIRDREGQIQVTVNKDSSKPEILNLIGSLSREDCVSVTGKVKSARQAPGGLEIIPDDVKIIAKAETPLPLETSDKIQSGFDKRFEFRFIDVRNPKVQTLFRIRHAANNLAREFYNKEGFVEVHTPVIQAAGAEGGATLFPLVYYKKEAFLRQSPQLYKQILMASSFDKVYEIGPVFRAEKFHTRRHVSEYLSVDGEMAWIESEEDVLKNLEGLSHYILKGLKERYKAELEVFGARIMIPELPFPRLTYDDVLRLLEKEGVRIEWGDDLDDPHEVILGKLMEKKGHPWFFITKYPSKIKPFYIMFDGEVSRGFDLEYKGLEVSSGGQREHRHDVLVKVMKSKGLQPENFKFYLDAFRYGMPPHGGYGYGIERVIQQVLGLDNIKETILFPRTPERLIP